MYLAHLVHLLLQVERAEKQHLTLHMPISVLIKVKIEGKGQFEELSHLLVQYLINPMLHIEHLVFLIKIH